MQFTFKCTIVNLILHITNKSIARRSRKVRSVVAQFVDARDGIAFIRRSNIKATCGCYGSQRSCSHVFQSALWIERCQTLLDKGLVGRDKLSVGLSVGGIEGRCLDVGIVRNNKVVGKSGDCHTRCRCGRSGR